MNDLEFNTLTNDVRTYTPAIRLNRYVSRKVLSLTRPLSCFLFLCTGGVALVILLLFPQYLVFADVLGAFGLITFSLWVIQFMVFCYHNSYYYHGFTSVIGSEKDVAAGATFDVADVVDENERDITAAFLNSIHGSIIMARINITPEAINQYLTNSRPYISTDMVPIKSDRLFSLLSLGDYIYLQDKTFRSFLLQNGVEDATFLGAMRWVINSHYGEKFNERWWGKDKLSRTEGIGRDWSYGTTYNLDKFSRDINTSAVFSTLTSNSAFAAEKIETIEHILARSKAANVLLLGEPGVGKMDLMVEISRRLRRGEALNAIENKQLIVLDTDRLFASFSEKQEFEAAFMTLLDEARKAGNVIIVIENISSFIKQAAAIDVMVTELMDQYLASPAVQFVVTESPHMHHAHLEQLGAFTRRFEEVLIDTPNLDSTTWVLQSIAEGQEKKSKSLFTYQSLQAITEAADRYIVDGVMPDKAISLLIDIATTANQQSVATITADFVFSTVSKKTGIPTGPISEEERDLLLHLEDRLHQRVIGQERAIDAIARTMRRSRAGIQKSDRPIGSFLFLGPTGVGKTETAKALSFVFFGAEEKMHRIDMSEFSGEDAVARMIGDTEHSGVLSDMLQEHPYSVLLLDEFEKGAQEVHDLFLQILDEGMFTDGRGQKINARNSIIIATSNAGSQLIMRTIQARKDVAVLERNIIDHIIQEGMFRPELINRFDSTIIFESLSIEEQGSVATLMLSDLHDRIRHRGYELTLSRDLIDVLVEKGYDPEFGARPMQRVIQDLIEEKIAQKIIGGEVKTGDTITLTKADFSAADLATAQ